MNDRPLIFVSHASSDKPRIGRIVQALLDAGFRLFIDHPENIGEMYTGDYCRARGIETLWSNQAIDDWSPRLREALDACDCVLAIASEALTVNGVAEEDRIRLASSHRLEWRAEMMLAEGMRKLVLARIASFDASSLPSYIKGRDMQNLSPDLDDARFLNNLRLLIDERITPTIANGRKFGADDAGASDRLRLIKDLLPLCVGRRYQRRAILQSAKSVALGAIRSVVVMGPENELPADFIQAIGYSDDGQAAQQTLVTMWVDLPRTTGSAFARDFAENISEKFFAGDYSAGLPAVAERLLAVGHPTIVHVRMSIEGVDIAGSPLADWLRFWERFGAEFPRAPAVPVASLFLASATPGWTARPQSAAPDWFACPPADAGSAAARARNLAAWRWLCEQRGDGEAARFLLPDITAPIAHLDAQTWSDGIREEVLPRARRQALRDEIDDRLFPGLAERAMGINHKAFCDSMDVWFDRA